MTPNERLQEIMNSLKEQAPALTGTEVLDKRTAGSKTFSLGQGIYQTVIYPEAIHYQEQDGAWQEIDNRFERRKTRGISALENQAGALRVKLADRANAQALVSLADAKGRCISWNLVGAADVAADSQACIMDAQMAFSRQSIHGTEAGNAKRGQIVSDLLDRKAKGTDEGPVKRHHQKMECLTGTARYRDILPNTDLICQIQGSNFKDILVLNAVDTPKAFAFAMSAPGLAFARTTDGLAVVDGTDRVFFLPNAFLVDAEGQRGNVETVFDIGSDGAQMVMRPDPDFMKDAAYPVMLDPAVIYGKQDFSLVSVFVDSAEPGTSFSAEQYLRVGSYGAGNGMHECKVYLKAFDLPGLTSSHMIVNASLEMYQYFREDSRLRYAIHEVKAPWHIDGSLTWHRQPAVDETLEIDSTIGLPKDQQGWRHFELTQLVRKWCEYPAQNHGIQLRTTGGYAGLIAPQQNVWPTARPILSVIYVSKAGLLPYLAYESQSIGRGGTGHVGLFNGNLVFTRGLTSTNGNVMPVSLGLVYNSCDAKENAFRLSGGWRFTVSEHLHKEEVDLGGTMPTVYYVYTADGGTAHYFSKGENETEYKDESGLSMKLSFANGIATITDKGHNRRIFNEPTTVGLQGRMVIGSIINALDKSIQFEYKAPDNPYDIPRLTGLVDGTGRRTTIQYDGNGRPCYITPPGYANFVGIEYDGQGRLYRVTDLDGVSTTYSYEETGLLAGAYNSGAGADQRSVTYTYYDGKAQRVQTARELGNGIEGNYRKYSYTGNVTTIKDLTRTNGKQLFYQFNDTGNTVSVRDELGFASFTNFLANTPPNKPADISKLQRMVINLLKDPGFERDDINESGVALTNRYWSFHREGLETLLWIGYSRDQKATGTRSLVMSAYESTNPGYVDQFLTIERGKTYTFSALVKSEGAMEGWLDIACGDPVNTWRGATSARLKHVPGWTKLSCSITVPSNAPHDQLCCRMWAGHGGAAVYFDAALLEEGDVASDYNNELLENGDISRMANGQPVGWQPLRHTDPNTDLILGTVGLKKPPMLGSNLLRIKGGMRLTGDYGDVKHEAGYVQSLGLAGRKGDSYVLSGWARANSGPARPNDYRCFRIRVSFRQVSDGKYTNGNTVDFNPAWVDWQYASGGVVAPEDYNNVAVYVEYFDNLNYCYFGAVSLRKELYGEGFAYDEKGNVAAVSDLVGQKHEIKYDDCDNIEKYVQPGRSADRPYKFNYGDQQADRKKHLLRSQETPLGEKATFTYDGTSGYQGNVISTVAGNGDTLYMETRNEYTVGGNYVKKTIDARGNAVIQETETNKGLLLSVTDPAGQKVSYTYDAANRVTGVETTQNGQKSLNTYTYERDRLKTVAHNTTGDTADVVYAFDYDGLGNQTTVKVGSTTLSRNVYSATGDKLLERVEYSNGGSISYTYDEFKRLRSLGYDGPNTRFYYSYDSNGTMATMEDLDLGCKEVYLQDLAQRPIQIQRYDGLPERKLKYVSTLSYDKFNNVASSTETLPQEGSSSLTYETRHDYDEQNRAVKLVYESKLGGGAEGRRIDYSYDGLGRINKRTVRNGTADDSGQVNACVYDYVSGGYGAKSTSNLIGAIRQAGHVLKYSYDAVGNLTEETHEWVSDLSQLVVKDTQTPIVLADAERRHSMVVKIGQAQGKNVAEKRYSYDKLGQLIRVDDYRAKETWLYSYDRGGNILSKVRHGYTANTLGEVLEMVDYKYDNRDWKDQLTSFKDRPIVYDAIGNPISYYGWSYTWKAGRILTDMQTDWGGRVSFVYDHNGIRVKKIVNGVITEYTLRGKQVVHLKKPGHEMHFYYDEQGRPGIVRYNGVDYAYVHNLQGDIIGILDMAGNQVVEYTYDAWGKPQERTGSMAGTLGWENPFRYRGYVWDEETGLYYLRSRYYSPEWGRFINADTLLGKTGALLSHNIFAYCNNDSVNMSDIAGLEPINIHEYTQQRLADINDDDGYGEQWHPGYGGKNNWRYRGNAKLHLPGEVIISGTFSHISSDYHIDFFPEKLLDAVPSLKKAAGGSWGWETMIPIYLELDYPKEKIYGWAVVTAYPHVSVNGKGILKDGSVDHNPDGTAQLCVWLIDSSYSNGRGRGKYNDAVKKAPLAFRPRARMLKPGEGGSGWTLF